MCTNTLRCRLVVAVAVWLPLVVTSLTHAITLVEDPIQGAGFVDVDLGPPPTIAGAPVGTPLEVDVVFSNMRHIELMNGATTNVEFAIGNTANSANLIYSIFFALSDMHGDLITPELPLVNSVAPAGLFQIVNIDLTPLPAVIFHDFHVRVDTQFEGPNNGTSLFDLFIAGGAGDLGTGASGPVKFNRAVVGEWVPEPSSAALTILGSSCLLLGTGARRIVPRSGTK